MYFNDRDAAGFRFVCCIATVIIMVLAAIGGYTLAEWLRWK